MSSLPRSRPIGEAAAASTTRSWRWRPRRRPGDAVGEGVFVEPDSASNVPAFRAVQTRMDAIARDLRHAFARLIRDRGFTAVTVVTLALGIGANTAVFSLVKAALLSPLPYGDAERLTVIWGPDRADA